MSADRKSPWLKFYGSDWRSDLGLRGCSLAARGLWIDMLTIMHEADRYGHLLINGIAPTPKKLAVLLSATEREIIALMGELETAGVFSRDEEGIAFSRRMIRDAERDAANRANGKQGGNPKLKGEVNPPRNPTDNGGVNPQDKPGEKPKVNGGDKAHYQKPEARSQKEERAQRARDATKPRIGDPLARWLPLAEKTEVDHDGNERPVIGGYYLDGVAETVCKAAGIDGTSGQVDWLPMVGWLRDGISPDAVIVPAIERIAARPGYQPPRYLSYFDAAVRERRAA